jgi:hypothetical protein
MEVESDMELDWYLSYYKDQVKSIDYGITAVENDVVGAQITLQRIGLFPMPVDVLVTYESGREELHTIPLVSMYGAKRQEGIEVHEPWPWTHPEYKMYIPTSETIKRIEIDPSKRMLDIDQSNNVF